MEPMKYPEFNFSSPLAATIIDLERLRADLGHVTTPPTVFQQLKDLFQLLTSIMSARIEGNRTSIVDALEGEAGRRSRFDGGRSEGVEEILRLQEAADFIDTAVEPGTHITHGLVRELHRITVEGLQREGDRTPGAYRDSEVSISGATHRPPTPGSIQADMTDLLDFANGPVEQSYDLLKMAITHHRFVWIHPFGNGNGRVCRLFSYALMVSQGFAGGGLRILNPTAVFGADRAEYYERLADADSLGDDAIVRWCEYLLGGLRQDLERLARLGDAHFVVRELLEPAIQSAVARGVVRPDDGAALRIVARQTQVKATDLSGVFPGSSSSRSQQIRRLVDQHLLDPEAPGKRSYHLAMSRGPLVPFVIRRLDELGFLPEILREDFEEGS